MSPALHGVVFDEAFGKGDVTVCAGIANGMHRSRGVTDDRNGSAIDDDPNGRAEFDIAFGADLYSH